MMQLNFFCGEFPPFCKLKKKPSTSTNYYFFKIIYLFFSHIFLNDIILQWVLGFGAEI
jgi:hypothetical protein